MSIARLVTSVRSEDVDSYSDVILAVVTLYSASEMTIESHT